MVANKLEQSSVGCTLQGEPSEHPGRRCQFEHFKSRCELSVIMFFAAQARYLEICTTRCLFVKMCKMRFPLSLLCLLLCSLIHYLHLQVSGLIKSTVREESKIKCRKGSVYIYIQKHLLRLTDFLNMAFYILRLFLLSYTWSCISHKSETVKYCFQFLCRSLSLSHFFSLLHILSYCYCISHNNQISVVMLFRPRPTLPVLLHPLCIYRFSHAAAAHSLLHGCIQKHRTDGTQMHAHARWNRG